MARTIAEIKADLVAKKAAESALDDWDSDSAVAEWNLWLDIVAFCTYVLEQLFDFFKADVDATIATQKPHTLEWYATKAKAFQYGVGVSLPPDTDVYPVVPPEDLSVLVVSEAAAIEIPAFNLVRIKVAKRTAGVLGPLSAPELTAFNVYLKRIKDAGVRVQGTSDDPDDLKLKLKIHYDALVINAAGERIDGTDDAPVKTAINTFLGAVKFNGVVVLGDLVDAIEAVEGVSICEVMNAEANYAITPYVAITSWYIPDGGYMALNETYFDDEVIYVVYEY